MVDKNQIKSKLVELYSSSDPQVFAQLHGDFDRASAKINTASRVYDLRAGAIMQILFVDGLPNEQAIEYLRAAITHLEVMDMPKGPILLPDGSQAE